jgi:Vam6/Vps39-like protein vacuolar protein sorting-associated protein 39
MRPNSNIYLTLLQIYLNPRKTAREAQRNVASVVSQVTPKPANSKIKGGSRLSKKVVEIEFAEEARFSASGTDSGRSDLDMDEFSEDGQGQSQEQEGSKGIMLNEALDLLSKRWDRINGAQALKLLPRDTKLQVSRDECYYTGWWQKRGLKPENFVRGKTK